jgi:hypothetical protein
MNQEVSELDLEFNLIDEKRHEELVGESVQRSYELVQGKIYLKLLAFETVLSREL